MYTHKKIVYLLMHAKSAAANYFSAIVILCKFQYPDTYLDLNHQVYPQMLVTLMKLISFYLLFLNFRQHIIIISIVKQNVFGIPSLWCLTYI